MGSEGMVQELERLRQLLDVTPANQLRQDGTGGASASDTAYTGALSAAEDTVDRLNGAMESGEDEIDAAFRRTGDLHKSNAARKDAELQELRRVVAAKEKSIDSLRTQLATTKGSLEAYTQESEAILQQRDGEVQRLQEDVSHLETEKHEHESTIIEQQDHIEKLQDNCRELQEAAQAVQQDSDVKYAASIAQMKQERKQQEQLKHDVAGLQKQLASQKQSFEEEAKAHERLQEEHERELRHLKKDIKHKLDNDIREYKHQLKAERRARKAAESWLRSELKSREEIESLFVSVRDIILAKPSDDIAELAGLINSSPRRRRMQELQLDDLQHLLQELTADADKAVHARRSDGDASQKLMQQENLLLRAKVAHAKQMLQRNGDTNLDLLSAPLNISGGSRNIKSGHRSHSKSERRSPQSVLQGDNERLKAELQRVHNDIAEQLKDLQV
ncbi:TPA: hypothetical protein ACH3X2_012048 [Trebouxia sp. C0005]